MRIPLLHQMSERTGPFVSVSVDASRVDAAAGREIEVRWREHQAALTRAGAPAAALSLIGELVLPPTGRPGRVGRLVVADRDGIALDLVLPAPPVREEAVFGPAPHLLPAFRALNDRVPYVLAEVDRTGADVTIVDELGLHDEMQVTGDHDELHKTGGGMSRRRIEARVEDSWARNAAEVARELDALVARHRPAAVLLGGDVIAVGDVLDAASGRVTEVAVRLGSGGRAEGTSDEARDAEIEGVLVQLQRVRHQELLDRFGTAEGRQGAAVQSLPDVVDAARRAQIEELLLHDDPTSTDRLWVGEQPLQLGATHEEAISLGASSPQRVRADTALVWAIVHADSGVTLLDPDQRALTDGIGALLRWSDRSTPHDAIPSMPGHGGE